MILRYFWSILATLLVLTASVVPVPESSLEGVPLIDKWVHFVMYGGLACAVWLDTYRNRTDRRVNGSVLLWTVVYPIVFGALMEIVQAVLTTYRSGEWLDLLADAVGVLIALPIGWLAVRPLARYFPFPRSLASN